MGRLVEWKMETINATVSRTKVLDGWIVLYKEGVSSAMAYVRDVYHDWNVLAEALPPPMSIVKPEVERTVTPATTSLPPVIAPHLGAPIKPQAKPKPNVMLKGQGVPESKL